MQSSYTTLGHGTWLGLTWLGFAWRKARGKGDDDVAARCATRWGCACVKWVWVVSGVVTNGSMVRQDGSKLWT